MLKRFTITIFLILISLLSYSQTLSDQQRKDILSDLQKQITIVSAFSSEKLDMIPVYNSQLLNANKTLDKYEVYKSDNLIYAKWFELKTLVKQNKEMVDFLEPRVGDWFYRKAVGFVANNEKDKAVEFLNKALVYDSKNVMVNYELAKISLDSGKIVGATNRLTNILSQMQPDDEEKLLCQNLIAFAYDKNLLKSLSLINQGKYAYAVDILTELDAYCQGDIYGICNKAVVKKNLDFCKTGIYNEHITVSKKAMEIGRSDVAGDFVQNTYDYFQRNRQSITDTTSFEGLVRGVVNSYIGQIKDLYSAKNNEAKIDLIRKTKELVALVGGEYEAGVLKTLSSLQGNSTPVDMKLDSIENAAPLEGFTHQYAQYVKDSVSNAQEKVKEIEKQYVPSSENKLPEKSLAVEQTKTKSLKKEIDDKFYESRTFMTVSNYDKAMEVLEKANRLAKIDVEKQEVEKMYTSAIREISARRMSAAEYAIFQGDVAKADSLVAKTNDLITTYKMENDPTIINIMNSYLRVIDQKVCQKKQDEIDVFVYNILDCVRRNDFYRADQLITTAMQVKGSSECRLDKQKIRQLKRQIEKPLEYVNMKEGVMKNLENKDTLLFIKTYAELEQFWNDNKLIEISVEHLPLRKILYNTNNSELVIKSIEELVKYRLYFGSLEALGALKDMGFKRKQTKEAQKKIGMMMSLDVVNRPDKIRESNIIDDKFKNDKWFKDFYKSYNKYLISWRKNN
ncbi:MAG: hypothetical protein H6Q16_142 [Bacteroidetes bacterium]|nr:hypothetical protein [Bacteroidota bacterium]